MVVMVCRAFEDDESKANVTRFFFVQHDEAGRHAFFVGLRISIIVSKAVSWS